MFYDGIPRGCHIGNIELKRQHQQNFLNDFLHQFKNGKRYLICLFMNKTSFIFRDFQNKNVFVTVSVISQFEIDKKKIIIMKVRRI